MFQLDRGFMTSDSAKIACKFWHIFHVSIYAKQGLRKRFGAISGELKLLFEPVAIVKGW